MRLIQKLKGYENRYVYMKWASGGEYGKIKYVGEDFVEFDIVDVDSMSYQETVLIYAPLILEVSIGGSDISRIVAEISSQLTP
jgi:hypothetical protein